MNEYQVVGFVPIDSIHDGQLFTLGNELALLYNVRDGQNFHCLIRKYDLFNATSPKLIEEIKLPRSYPSYYFCEYNNPYVFTYPSYDSLEVFDINRGNIYRLHFSYRFFSVAAKDSIMFTLSDSGLEAWNVSNFNYPIMFYKDLDTGHFSTGALEIDDTLMFEWLSNNIIKLWDVKNPSQPQMISSGFMRFVAYPIKIIINKRNIFISAGERYDPTILRCTLNDSGNLILEQTYHLNYVADQMYDFLINQDMIYILLYGKLIVGNAQNFNDSWEQIPIPSLVSYPNFIIYNNLIYILARYKGIFIYKRTEEQ